MFKFFLRTFFILEILTSLLFPSSKEENLSQKYKDWLKIVSYIILPQEKEIFLKLESDRDRDIFIEAFWKQRDPTPGTPENEFKEEHYRRFLYANEHFKRGTSREGWMTDMGRIYIILGPPNSIERFDMQSGIYPCEVWYYYGDKKKGLPTQFAVIFYKRGGVGEYKLYNPASDGPESLLVDTQGVDITDPHSLYKKIKELAPTLANVSFTLIPGQAPYTYAPSQNAQILLSQILELPKKTINPTYATNFLNYKGIVSTEYATNYVECDFNLSILKDQELNMNFVNLTINPKKISVDYFEPKDQFYLNYQLNVSLKRNEDIIFQYTKDYPIYIQARDIEKIKGGGISIQDFFPVLEGDYIVTVLIQNSVAKEFSYFEKAIHIPEKEGAYISGLNMGYSFKDEENFYFPYKIGSKRFFIDPKNIFSPQDGIFIFFSAVNISKQNWERGEIEIVIERGEKREIFKRFSIFLKDFQYSPNINFSKSIEPGQLPPDYYRLNLYLKEGENILDSKKLEFTITGIPISHPNIFLKRLPSSNNFLLFYMLASQADRINKNEEAEIYYKKTLNLNPDFKDGILNYLNFLVKVKRFDEALNYVEKIKESEKFDYYLIKGLSLMGLGRFKDAVDNLLEGNKIYNSDLRLLNALGFCYYKLGKKEEALQALKASLSLNPKQKDVENLIISIEKGRLNKK